MKRPVAPEAAAVQGILDGLDFLAGEALRCRRSDVALILIEALHEIDALGDKVPRGIKRNSCDVYAA